MSSPSSVAKAINALVYMVANSRGSKYNSTNSQYTPMPIVQNLTVTPKYAVQSIGEFGTPNDILTFQDYSNCDVSFDIYETDLGFLYNMLMDVDPAGSNVMFMPELLYKAPFTIFGNQVHMSTGNIIQGFVLCQVLLSDSSESQDLKNAKKITFKGTGTLYRKVMNGAIDYVRGNAASVAFPTPYGKTFSGGNVVLLNYSPVSEPLPGSNTSTSTQSYAVVLQNGAVMPPTGTSPWSISGTSFILSSAPASTDYWDVFVPVATHKPYSGGPD
jgi:hypothetical protein